jgi:uncharacterized LabA/DUF88 family protein
MNSPPQNYAFIDGQNLHMGVTEVGWKIDYKKLRIYLKDKYKIGQAFYFIGYYSEKYHKLYQNLTNSGFKLIFKETSENLKGNKKGNINTDLVFELMKLISDSNNRGKVLIISGDGDYKKLINHLMVENKFERIVFPNKKASTLYNDLGSEYFDYLYNIKEYIELSS